MTRPPLPAAWHRALDLADRWAAALIPLAALALALVILSH